MRTLFSNPSTNRERAEQSQKHEYHCGDRRQDTGGEERDAGLVSKRREVVYASQAHYLPPRMLVMVFLLTFERPFNLFNVPSKQPALEGSELWLSPDRLRPCSRCRHPSVLPLSRIQEA